MRFIFVCVCFWDRSSIHCYPKGLQHFDAFLVLQVVKIGDEFFTFIVDCESPKACTILLRGASKDILNEVRAMRNGVRVILNEISSVGQNHIYIRCIYGIIDREIIKYTVTYGVYIRFWPTLEIRALRNGLCISMAAAAPNARVFAMPCFIIKVGLARTVYIHRIFGDSPAKNTVYAPYIYGSGQPYIKVLLRAL